MLCEPEPHATCGAPNEIPTSDNAYLSWSCDLHRATHAAWLRSGIPPGHLIKAYVSYLIRVTGLITHPATPLHGKGSNLGLD